MDIKEIALRLLAEEFPGMHQENQAFMVEFAEALIESYKAELLKEVGEPVAWASQESESGDIAIDSEDNPATEYWSASFPLYTSDQVAAAILKAEQRVAEWQPISTAPKDGTVFLGYKLGQFRECYKVPRDDCDMWCFGGTSGADDLFPNIKPTHWMPLPKAPANGASS